jgi:hypothetical protein
VVKREDAKKERQGTAKRNEAGILKKASKKVDSTGEGKDCAREAKMKIN